MSWFPDRYRELRSLLRADRPGEDVSEELSHHIESRVADLVARGLPPLRAREEALRRFGDMAGVHAEVCGIDESILKERRRMEVMDAVRRETRLAVRSLLQAPVFTVVAILTLGLGIGATTAIFTLIDSIVLRPLPYPESERLVQVWHAVPRVGPGARWGSSVASHFHYQDNNRTFEEYGAGGGSVVALSGDGEAERIDAATLTASMQRLIGARVVLGRLLTDDDELPGAEPVVVLSNELWRNRYAADPSIVGRTILVNSMPVTVVGVTAAGTRLPASVPQVWLPLQLDRTAPAENAHWVGTYGRLRAGVSIEEARQDLQRLADVMPSEFPRAYSEGFYESTGFHPVVTTTRAELLGSIDRVLWMLLGAVSLVLVIACANVANLFLVRAESRCRERTVRAALGSDGAHFAVHYLTESLLLGLSAAAVGALLAYAGVQLLVSIAPAGVPRLDEVGLGWTGITFALAAGAGMGLLFGAAPLFSRREDFGELRDGGRGTTAGRRRQYARGVLVVGQVALALVLLAAGGLMVRSFVNLRSVPPGFDADNVLTFQAFVPAARYPTRDAQLQFRRELDARLLALPGVTHVGGTTNLPLAGGGGCAYTTVEGHVYSARERPPCTPVMHVLPGYFESMGIAVEGETITWSDVDLAAGVAVVSRAFATRMWPGEDPIGKGVIAYEDGPPWYRVVGVADDIRGAGLDEPAIEAVYYPPRAMEGACCSGNAPNWFVVRTSTADPTQLAPAIRGILMSMDSDVPLANVRTMHEVVRTSPAMARMSFTMLLLAIAAAMALFLSAVGLYGVIAYLTAQRRGEIGVRMALGARAPQIVRLVVLRSVGLAGIGVVAGVAGALAGTGVMRTLLFEVQPADPKTLATASAVLLLVAALASAAPAWHAARTDPSEALRAD